MNQDIKKRWVDALRSGEFEQGKEALRKGDQFCCLGVLCELAVQDGVIAPAVLDLEGSDVFSYGKDVETESYGNTGELPEVVANWAGINPEYDDWADETICQTDPYVPIDGTYKTLSELNDGGLPFAELAQIIEEKL